jgi:purine nucleosidase
MTVPASRAALKVVHEGDHGIDDAVATLFQLDRDDVELVAIGTVHGNAHADQAASNALQLIEVAGRSGIPVAVGASRPLVQPADSRCCSNPGCPACCAGWW